MTKQCYICMTCGAQYAAGEAPPQRCEICADERQYVGHDGQRWTTMEALAAERHNVIRLLEPSLSGIGTQPQLAIGQRALLVQTSQGNVLWDCISLLDEPTIAAVKALGGIAAIAISHPHFYTSMVEWSHAFDAPIYLHVSNRPYVVRPDSAITFWDGEHVSLPGRLTAIRCGGHFPGSTVLHWPNGAGGRGALLTGDTMQVVPD